MRIKVRNFPLVFRVLIMAVAMGIVCELRAQKPSTAVENYLGFSVDCSEFADDARIAELRAAIHEQIDIVCSVGLTEEVQGFFKSVPMRLFSGRTALGNTPGLYSAETRAIELTAAVLKAGHKPVLLHELLHAYHHQKIPGGFDNKVILKFYKEGKSANCFTAKSHMMDNAKEYFACCATTYLFGVTAQPPFRREKVQSLQPDFYTYISSLFGPTTGNFEGSLER